MSQPAIFPYLTGLEKYAGEEISKAADMYYQDNKEAVDNFPGYPMLLDDENLADVFKDAAYYVNYFYNQYELTDSQISDLILLVGIMRDSNYTDHTRKVIEYMLSDFESYHKNLD